MSKKVKTWLIIAAIILTILVVVAVYYYRKGKRQNVYVAPPGDNPNAGAGTGNTTPNPNTKSDSELKALANQLHQSMDGVNFFGQRDEVFRKVLELSDTDLVKLYNFFNAFYQATSGETLKQWIEGESGWWSGGVFAQLREGILTRMTSLNLK